MYPIPGKDTSRTDPCRLRNTCSTLLTLHLFGQGSGIPRSKGGSTAVVPTPLPTGRLRAPKVRGAETRMCAMKPGIHPAASRVSPC